MENSPTLLAKLGAAIIETLSRESRNYFAKRRWSGKDPKGGPPIWESFHFRIRGKSTLEITSTFYGMAELASGDIPARRMVWLTQEAKDKHPEDYELTDAEKKLKMKKSSRLSPKARGKIEPANTSPTEAAKKMMPGPMGKPKPKPKKYRLPLVVPVKASNGDIVFRMAPLKTSDAWIHPGIAKFTFFEVAIKKARQECARILREEVARRLKG